MVRRNARRSMGSQRPRAEKGASVFDEGSDHRHDVPRTLAEPAAEVGKPVRSVWDVLRHAMTLLDHLAFQRVSDALYHREFERRGMLTGELQGATDHAAVMTPDREVPRSTEQGLEVLEVGAVDLRACTVRDVRGLFVRSLDKTDPGRFLNQPIDVVGRPF